MLFATAPVFFVFAVLLTEIAERINLLYELKMTCKYTILQITAFRVVCFSLIGTVLCTLISLLAPFSGDYDIVRAPVSYTHLSVKNMIFYFAGTYQYKP